MAENTAIKINRDVHSRSEYGNQHSPSPQLDEPEAVTGWHVLWTRSNYERIVLEELWAKGYEGFLPMINQWSRGKSKKGRRICRVPMFKGYLFLRHAIDKTAYIDICKTDGLVSILGSRWDKLARIPDAEIENIKFAVRSQLPVLPYPYLEKGDKVRIASGSLGNAEGILVKSEPSKGLFVISVNLLRRSVAVEVDCSNVIPA
ncbi:MAG: transcription termination/antitermination NusG family protein [Pseudohongiellaceae bacterium]